MGCTPASHKKKKKKKRSEVKTTCKDVEDIERIVVEDSSSPSRLVDNSINASPDVKVESGTSDVMLKGIATTTLSKVNAQKSLKHTGNKKRNLHLH